MERVLELDWFREDDISNDEFFDEMHTRPIVKGSDQHLKLYGVARTDAEGRRMVVDSIGQITVETDGVCSAVRASTCVGVECR